MHNVDAVTEHSLSIPCNILLHSLIDRFIKAKLWIQSHVGSWTGIQTDVQTRKVEFSCNGWKLSLGLCNWTYNVDATWLLDALLCVNFLPHWTIDRLQWVFLQLHSLTQFRLPVVYWAMNYYCALFSISVSLITSFQSQRVSTYTKQLPRSMGGCARAGRQHEIDGFIRANADFSICKLIKGSVEQCSRQHHKRSH